MSNSRRRTPIFGMTGAESDKSYKQAEHRRERAGVRVAMVRGDDPPSRWLYGSPNKSEKDGKQYAPRCPEVWRK